VCVCVCVCVCACVHCLPWYDLRQRSVRLCLCAFSVKICACVRVHMFLSVGLVSESVRFMRVFSGKGIQHLYVFMCVCVCVRFTRAFTFTRAVPC
jgi:hypothetical protein